MDRQPGLGLFRLTPGDEVQQIPWAKAWDVTILLPRSLLILCWAGYGLGFFQGGVAYFKDGAGPRIVHSRQRVGQGARQTNCDSIRMVPSGPRPTAGSAG